MASKLKAGFRNITYDEINGKDEFNQETEFCCLTYGSQMKRI